MYLLPKKLASVPGGPAVRVYTWLIARRKVVGYSRAVNESRPERIVRQSVYHYYALIYTRNETHNKYYKNGNILGQKIVVLYY